MSYWLREVAGWALVLVGLYTFWQSYDFLLRKRVFEAGPLSFIGFIVFRGGIHVLKVAVAAQAARNLPAGLTHTPKKPGRPGGRPVGPTPSKSVLPGPHTSRPRQPAGGRGDDLE